MLWILSLEALGWVARGASAENLLSAQSAAVSIMMACYALLLIGAGVVYRSGLNRMLGLGLIALVVAKLDRLSRSMLDFTAVMATSPNFYNVSQAVPLKPTLVVE